MLKSDFLAYSACKVNTMRSFIGLATSVLAAAGAVTAQTTLPNGPGGFGVVSNSTIAGNGSAVGTAGENDGKYSTSFLLRVVRYTICSMLLRT